MPEKPFHKVRPHPLHAAPPSRGAETAARHPTQTAYAELCVTSNFTFLTGASHPEELIEQAAALGYHAIALTDTNTLAGIVRAHVAAKRHGVRLIVGCRLRLLDPGVDVCVYPTDRAAYARLCTLLTVGKRRAPKGECHLTLDDLAARASGLLGVVMPRESLGTPLEREGAGDFAVAVERLHAAFETDALSLAAVRRFGPHDELHRAAVRDLSAATGVPLVASNDVLYHIASRRPLQDVVTCIRHGCTIHEAGFRLVVNAERHLKPGEEMARLFAEMPGAIERSLEIARRASGFSLDQIKYQYPLETCPPEMTPTQYLRQLAYEGAAERYGGRGSGGVAEWQSGTVEKARESGSSEPSLRESVAVSLRHSATLPLPVSHALEHELALIAELGYETYFLTCHDIVRFARSRGILCQGRGGAANSAVCYCLGITEVDPSRFKLLFERFISRARKEPPDIDIDFEHERREEVIQYIYAKYGRERAALTAEVISYRGRSAVRDIGKAMGLSEDCIDALAKNLDRWHEPPSEERVREVGLDPREPTIRRVIELAHELAGFPRHLSQHVGGFVITQAPLSELVPIENAAMEDRTVIEWDKDDIDAMGMLKVDVLGLGMLTCVGKCVRLMRATERRSDGATKGRADTTRYGNAGVCQQQRERSHGHRADIPGLDRVAAEHGIGEGDLSRDAGNAHDGAVRTDDPDAKGCDLDPVQHRRGARQAEPCGLLEVSANQPRLTDGTRYAVGVGDDHEPDTDQRRNTGAASRDRPHTAGPDPQPGAEAARDLNGSLPSSLRHFVAPSLLSHIPDALRADDSAVYDMICKADTVGVFQIESRAQMSMLPRLRPRTFYDLVIEVAIVRPGPIQGGMVHPYLRRREGKEPVTYPSPEVEGVLGRTLGVPLFQEQAMQLAIVAAGFTPDEADGLRKSMAAWKRKGSGIYQYGQKLMDGMISKGYPREFAERCFEQIKGFSEYGFPESHAASFALIVYYSAWLKRYHPAAFAAALINSQPMGFYQPAQIVRDAQEHGVEVREVDVNWSGWDCSLEESDGATDRQGDEGEPDTSRCSAHSSPSLRRFVAPSLRLGTRLVKGLAQEDAERVAAAVQERGPFRDVESLWRASGVSVRGLRCLAQADAFASMGLTRQQALWQIKPLRDERLPLFEMGRETNTEHASFPLKPRRGEGAESSLGVAGVEPQSPRGAFQDRGGVLAAASPEAAALAALPPIAPCAQVLDDYEHVGLSLKAHPLSFLREHLRERAAVPCEDLRSGKVSPQGRRVWIAGLVLVRQRPSTASGVVFITLEDETGIANLVVWATTFEQYRRVARLSSVLLVRGVVERQGDVVHVHVDHLETLDHAIPEIMQRSRNFH